MKNKSHTIDSPLFADRLAILRAADDLIGQGGRNLLAKILKGSKDKKLLSHGLETNPSYGYFRELTLEEITRKIDWMIEHDFLEIEMSGKLPMLIFTERGWTIERAQRAEEFMREWDLWISQKKTDLDLDMSYLKDRNRGLILLFLDRVKHSANPKYIPFLRQWHKIDYKKVQAAILETIQHIERGESAGAIENQSHEEEILRLLEGPSLEAERLKCWECGERFIFEVDEQKFFKMKGFQPPKRCPACRERNALRRMGIDMDL
ncbi:RQC-minor-1 family DNA-binding protein [Cohnella silvisoli]|uniref:RQC-minor-1 family DNA-binding protein n=1 Tax=Cohnella silvisoli TaxID=2873699 RepID=A0ABV1KLG6_9BACL|nr:RQC-minor-1 family DNA-binding protein [Cohnella silvisoli]MCD9020698.1 zinc-ribbon domain containing protein [Cohnella silvisoli]